MIFKLDNVNNILKSKKDIKVELTEINFSQPNKIVDCGDYIYSYLYLNCFKNFNDKILVGNVKGNILLFDVETSELKKCYDGHTSKVYSITDLNNWKENCFGTCSLDKMIKIFNIENSQPIQTIDSCNFPVFKMINLKSYDPNSFVVGVANGELKLFSTNNESDNKFILNKENKNCESSIYNILHIFNSNYNYILTLHESGELFLINTDDLSTKRKYMKEHTEIELYALVYYKEDMFFTFGYKNRTLKLWSFNNSSSLITFDSFDCNINSVHLSNKLDILICCLDDKTINVIDLIKRKRIKTIKSEYNHRIFEDCLNNSKYQLICTDHNNQILLY